MPTILQPNRLSRVTHELLHEIVVLPVDDVHCHAIPRPHPVLPADVPLTAEDFLELLSLSAFPLYKYFPPNVYLRWFRGDADTRVKLDRRYGIVPIRREVLRHASETMFLRMAVKELASFFKCLPALPAVIEARNAAAQDFDRYVGSLFRDAGIANVIVDTGYPEALTADGLARFERAIAPTRSWRISRVEEHLSPVFDDTAARRSTFSAVEEALVTGVRSALDGQGRLGGRSYGMKSYLIPDIGLFQPLYRRALAVASWNAFRARLQKEGVPAGDAGNREERWALLRDALRYFHTIAVEECLERDLPIQFHVGDGEAPWGTQRHQDPFNLEELVRFDRDGMMRFPKVILLHAGYPRVGSAAWLSHLYANCYLDISLMNPWIHAQLATRVLEILEVAPISKILYGSDAYDAPELYWLAAKWARRALAEALGGYVEAGQLGPEEAVEIARMILCKNSRTLYRIPALP